MNVPASRILKSVFFFLVLLTALLLLVINGNLASLANSIYPGSSLWVHCALFGMEALAFLWLLHGLFGGRKHMLLVGDSSPEGKEKFARELVRRLRKNTHIREAGLVPSGPEDQEGLDRCMAFLNEKADKEIQQMARRVFLATALSQNGRLDALIVFISLCRLVWRISAIYNQRPHPKEIVSLYAAVVTATFLALSLEELDVSTEVSIGFGHAFNAMAPAGITTSIPFAGKALQTFTAAAIDGAANCYLALRTGIIARNAYSYAFAEKRPARAAVYHEAGTILLSMSAGMMDTLAAGVAGSLAGAVRYAQGKTVKAGKGLVEGLGKMGVGTYHGIAKAGGAASDAAGTAVSTTLNAAAKPFAHIFKPDKD